MPSDIEIIMYIYTNSLYIARWSHNDNDDADDIFFNWLGIRNMILSIFNVFKGPLNAAHSFSKKKLIKYIKGKNNAFMRI